MSWGQVSRGLSFSSGTLFSVHLYKALLHEARVPRSVTVVALKSSRSGWQDERENTQPQPLLQEACPCQPRQTPGLGHATSQGLRDLVSESPAPVQGAAVTMVTPQGRLQAPRPQCSPQVGLLCSRWGKSGRLGTEAAPQPVRPSACVALV